MDAPLLAGLTAIVFASAFVTGLIGAGGGILLLPLALLVLPPLSRHVPETHVLTGLSLVQGLAASAAAAVLSRRRGEIARERLAANAVPLAAGGLAGAAGSALLPSHVLLLVFAVVTSAAAGLLLIPPPGGVDPRPGRRPLAMILFGGVGVLGGAIGVGAGFLIIPVLLWVLGLDQRRATGTGFLLSFFLLGPALAGKALTGQVQPHLAALVAATALAGATAGAALSPRIPAAGLRLGLAALVAGLAVRVWAELLR